jgi:hypothetical protein
MTSDDDIESMWMEIRPVRLPPAEPEVPAPPEVQSITPTLFTSVQGLLGAAGHHGCECTGVFTSVDRRIAFRCSCGVTFQIGLPLARRTPPGPLRKYINTIEDRVTIARRLTFEPQALLLELEGL